MKKIIGFFLCFFLISFTLLSQERSIHQTSKNENTSINVNNQFSISIGVSSTPIDALNASSLGLSIGCDFFGLHLSYVSNGATGSGEYLEFSSSETYEENKKQWEIINIGVNLNIIKNLTLTPKIGFVTINSIFTDPILMDTYYKKKTDNDINLGINANYYIDDDVFLSLGTGTVENLYFGIGYSF